LRASNKKTKLLIDTEFIVITKNTLWKQICLGLKEHARSEIITAAVMKRIRELENEDNQVNNKESS